MQIFLEIYRKAKQNLIKDISLNNQSEAVHQHLNKNCWVLRHLNVQDYTVTS